MKKIFTLLLLCTALYTNAQVVPEIQWQHSIGSPGNDDAGTVIPTDDGGYISIGSISSAGGDVSSFAGGFGDYWVAKMDEDGVIEWERSYGGSAYDGGVGDYGALRTKLIKAADGGYILGGNSASSNGDVSANFGENDVWLVKINSSGDIEWEQNYGSDAMDSFSEILATADGGFIFSYFFLDINTLDAGTKITKIDALGNIEWSNPFGVDFFAFSSINSIIQTQDGGYIGVGTTDAPVSAQTPANEDFPLVPYDVRVWVLKISVTGAFEWAKVYGGTDQDVGGGIAQDPDGNYVVVGGAYSGDFDVIGHPNPNNTPTTWVFKLDSAGEILWQRTEGQASGAGVVHVTSDGNYVVGGNFMQGLEVNGELINGLGSWDMYLKKLDQATGNSIWTKRLGGSGGDQLIGFELTPDGGFIVAGTSNSIDGDLTATNGGYDHWIVKLGPDCDTPVVTGDVQYTVCSGSDLTLTAVSAGNTINWYASEDSTTILFTGADFVLPAVTTGGSYWAEAVSAIGCKSARMEVTVAVTPLPVATIDTTAYDICENETATLTASTTINNDIEWYDSATAATPIASGTEFITPALTAGTSYWVLAITPEGCVSGRTEITVTVNALPVVTVQDTALCGSAAATVTAGSSGNTINWYASATDATPLFTGAEFTTPVLAATTSYWAEAVSPEGCLSGRTEVTVTINALPVLTVANAAITICEGTPAVLTAASAGNTINWYSTETATQPVATGNEYTVAGLTANTSYWAEAVSPEGCVSVREEVAVTVNAMPVITVQSATVCEGATATVTAASAGNTVNWYSTQADTTILFTDTDFTTPSLSASTSYWVEAVSAQGCTTARVQVTVTVNPLPVITAGDTDVTICAGTTALLSATATGGSLVVWFDSETATQPIATGTDYTTLELGASASYWVAAYNPVTHCVSGKVRYTVTVNDNTTPVVQFNYGAAEYCFAADNPLPVLAAGFTQGGTFSTGSGLALDSDTGEIDVRGSQPGNYVVVYEVEDEDACLLYGRFETQVTIETCADIQRGISPNGDEYNQYFDLTGMGVRELAIFNRYGQEVYGASNYVKEWEGQDRNGNELPTGTYFYAISRNDGKQLTGWIYINREN